MRAFMNPHIDRTLRAVNWVTYLCGQVSAFRYLCACCCVGSLLLGTAENGSAFSLNGYHWPSGTQIDMHLQLTRPPVALQDGSASWNASAADALAIWSQYLDTVTFVQASPVTASGGDGANSVFFSSTIYGDTFGSTVLAVTLHYSDSGSDIFTETDVIFNNNRKWNSYRGPIQGTGATATYDFHRVALHEFGHVLGLDHPNQYGQSVAALMNSIIGDLDHLAEDDIAGVRSLYGAKITSSLAPPSGKVGEPLEYQITANNNPSTFEASPLPPGLQIDAGMGRISGTPTAGGTFNVNVIAHGPGKDVSATVRIVIVGPTITSYLSPTVDIGQTFSYQITTSQSASSYSAVGLPPGLSLDTATGLITGTPTSAGTFDVTLTAQTDSGGAVATLHLVVRAPRITSSSPVSGLDIGSSYSYQLTATGNPTRFSATGLPAGLQLDTTTGLISGIVELSGSYVITVTAHTDFGDAIAQFTLSVAARSTPVLPVATYNHYAANPTIMVADPRRPRVYVWTFGDITVIETGSLQIVKTIKILRPVSDLSLSADGNKLWVAYGSYDSSRTLGSIDLESLSALPDLALDFQPQQVREGLDARLYITDGTGSVRQVDKASGVSQAPFSTSQFGAYLEISPDRRTLYLGDYGLLDGSGSNLSRFDISGPSPALLQRVNNFGSGGRTLTISHNGAFLAFVNISGGIFQLAASDLTKVYGNIPGPTSGPIAYSPDDTQLFQTGSYDTQIRVFSAADGQLLRTIDLGGRAYDSSLLADATGFYLFFTGHGLPGPSQLRVYGLKAQLKASPPKTLLNVSTRLRTQIGDNALIGGFILKGSESKQLAFRAIGPSLPLNGKLADPVLQLFDSSGAMIAQNDNWNAHRTDVLATGIPPGDEHEAVITLTLPPDSYTAIVRGVNGGSGVALVEVYDLASKTASKLANISTRGKIEAGDNVMIGGFILGGDQTTTVVVRAIGPSLTNFGVGAALSDPMLGVHDGNGALLAQDDDWRQYQEQPLIDSGLAPTDDRESAMLLSLQPGAYTAIVRGKDSASGVGLVEVYNLDAN